VFEKINEQIEVLANFTHKRPVPLLFSWKGQKFKIAQINFVHTSYEGKALLVHFAVSTHKEAFNITFNTLELTWTLNDIYFDGFKKDMHLNEPRNTKNYNAY
jgi:hypothetical protein